mgnify:CR=1 FL=1
MNEKEVQDLGDKIVGVLKTIYDPEIPVNIYDLGLIYEVDVYEEDEVKIQKFAVAWAQELETEDGEALERAHKKLASPFDTDARMTPNGRNLYGKYLKEGLFLMQTDKLKLSKSPLWCFVAVSETSLSYLRSSMSLRMF